MTRRKAPKRRLPNVESIWSDNQWKWRARKKTLGHSMVGPLRLTQKEAYKDLDSLIVAQKAPGAVWTLAEALEAVALDAEQRQVAKLSVKNKYRAPAKFILEHWWAGETPLRSITAHEMQWAIGKALKHGRSPVTIRKGYCGLMSRAFKIAKLDNPVPEALHNMAAQLKATAPEMNFFKLEEIDELRGKMLGWVGKQGPAKTALRDWSIFNLVACTGIRMYELSRVKRGDVEDDFTGIQIAEAKVKSQPRYAPVPQRAQESLQVLCKGKKKTSLLVGKPPLLNSICERWKSRLGEPRLNLRALRHTYGTELIRRGVDFASVRRLMGHGFRSNETARYLHAIEEEAILKADVLSERPKTIDE